VDGAQPPAQVARSIEEAVIQVTGATPVVGRR
jgi:hypothetical protein